MASGALVTRPLHQRCMRCRGFFSKIEDYPAQISARSRPETVDFGDIVELELSARAGCHLCSLIKIELGHRQLEELHQQLEQQPELRGRQIEAQVWVSPLGVALDSPVEGPLLQLQEAWLQPSFVAKKTIAEFRYVHIQSENQERRLFTGIQPSTASWETFNDIHAWLRLCENEHQNCAKRRERLEFQYPTRLLYVGTFEGSHSIRVCESRDLLSRPRYATLSHCWGGIETGKLTSSEYATYKQGVPISDLPKNFRDAIALTRALGIEYLWIDSLCIIQDSAQDWDRECTLMSDVYGGSFINIAANAASNANGGIFQDRDPMTVTPLKARMTFRANRWLQRMFAIFPHSWDLGALDYAPLSGRAWAVQERLLAPRTIHFLSHKVIWECSSLQASESDTTGVLEKGVGNWSDIQRWALPSPRDHILFHREAACLWKWYVAVRTYTRGNLTFSSDKLIAISGVAKFLKDMWRDDSVRYLAGLWSYQLETSLVWSNNKGTPVAEEGYRAPTWSWASVNGPVHKTFYYHESRYELLSKVLEAYTEPINDEFGAVRAGYLKISGPLCRLQICRIDTEQPSLRFSLMIASTGHTLQSHGFHLDTGRDIYRQNYAASIDCVLAGIYKSLDITAVPMSGLVLQPTGEKNGQYTRIGSFEIDDWRPRNHNEEEAFHRLRNQFGRRDSNTPDPYQTNDYMRIEEAFESMDLPSNMYESKNEATFKYSFEII